MPFRVWEDPRAPEDALSFDCATAEDAAEQYVDTINKEIGDYAARRRVYVQKTGSSDDTIRAIDVFCELVPSYTSVLHHFVEDMTSEQNA